MDAFDWLIDGLLFTLGWQARAFVQWYREVKQYYATRNFCGELHGQATEAHKQKRAGKRPTAGHGG